MEIPGVLKSKAMFFALQGVYACERIQEQPRDSHMVYHGMGCLHRVREVLLWITTVYID